MRLQLRMGRLFPESKSYCFLSRKEEGRKFGRGGWASEEGDLLSFSPLFRTLAGPAGGLW